MGRLIQFPEPSDIEFGTQRVPLLTLIEPVAYGSSLGEVGSLESNRLNMISCSIDAWETHSLAWFDGVNMPHDCCRQETDVRL